MTYRYRTREELHVLKNNEVEESVLAEFFAKEIHDLIYIEEDSGNLLGTISYSDFVSQRWRKGIVQSESNRQSMKDEEVEEYFLSHPTNSRLPDVLSGKLIGEYFLPYVAGEDVQCKYNKFAISWFVYYLNDIDEFLHQWNSKKIIFLVDNEYQETIRRVFYEQHMEYMIVDLPEKIPYDTDYVINMKYPEKLRKRLIHGEIQGCSLYELTEIVVFKKTIEYLQRNGIDYVYLEGPDKHSLVEINEDEKKALLYQGSSSLFALACDDYIAKVAGGADVVTTMSPIIANGINYSLIDYNSTLYNVINGIRRTTDQPEFYSRSIHIFGPCIAHGFMVSDDNTVASKLQRKLNEIGSHTIVFNHGINGMGSLLNSCLSILATPLSQGDCVVEINTCFPLTKSYLQHAPIKYCDLCNVFVGKHYWFFNHPFHCNSEANNQIAEVIFDLIGKETNNNTNKTQHQMFDSTNFDNGMLYVAGGINEYLKYIKGNAACVSNRDCIGSIVMTADPFTEGHLFLVKKALERCHFLYIFVVQEESGTYSFDDRFKMVKNAVAQFKNVIVLSTGKLMHSIYTFPEYNFRGEVYSEEVDPSRELILFSNIIAPALNITMRFFGEEPTDKVTETLNKCAKKILPAYGISVVIIPRKQYGGKVISGSRVRKFVADRYFDELSCLVPETTLSYLRRIHDDLPNEGLVSIIVISSDEEEGFERCLTSVCNQTYKNIEIIIIIKNGSHNVIDELLKKDTRIIYAPINKGVHITEAMNIGVHIAKGKYITFIEDRDFVMNDYIFSLLKVAERTRADIVVSSTKEFSDLSEICVASKGNCLDIEKLFTGYEASIEYLTSHTYKQSSLLDSQITAKLFLKSLINKKPGERAEQEKDKFLIYKLYRNAARICIISAGKYYHLSRKKTVNDEQSSERIEKMVREFRERYDFYSEPYLKDLSLKNSVFHLNSLLNSEMLDSSNELKLFVLQEIKRMIGDASI